MAFNHHRDLKYILHPYIFVLKENNGIQTDLFDYSLCMMRLGSPETIRSPKEARLNPLMYELENGPANQPRIF